LIEVIIFTISLICVKFIKPIVGIKPIIFIGIMILFDLLFIRISK